MRHLFGMTCATITPMRSDGAVDYLSAAKLYRHLAENGVHCLYPNGTNGESLSLTVNERSRLAELCVNESAGRSVVYIQCGASGVAESYANLRHARDIKADGFGLMTPVFFPVDESGMERYYSRALEMAEDFPCYIYNIAPRTGNDVSVALFSRLSQKYGNLLGIKFSSPDLLRLADYVRADDLTDRDALIGCDQLALPCLLLGGKGYVSGPGAAFVHPYLELYDAFQKSDIPRAMAAQRVVSRTLEAMRGVPEIPAIKYLLMRQDVIETDRCRAPLRSLTAQEKQRLDALF